MTAGGVLAGVAYVARKVLGPTLDRLGSEFNEVSEQRGVTFKRILHNADAKLGEHASEDEPVHPRIVHDIIENGTWNDDDISVEYFGGILASSKTKIGRDDRAVPVLSVLARLSTYQKRTHYVFYEVVRRLFKGTDIKLNDEQGRRRAKTYIPLNVYSGGMNFTEEEVKNIQSIMNHVMFGLVKEDLIDAEFKFGDPEYLKLGNFEPEQHGIVFAPSGFGIELFMRAHGHANAGLNELFSDKFLFKTEAAVRISEGSRRVFA